LGDSQNTLNANIARCSGFVVAIVAASLGAGLQWLAIAGFLGELISLVVSSLSLAYRRSVFDPSVVFATLLLLLAIAVSMGLFHLICGSELVLVAPLLVAAGVGIVMIAACILYFERPRKELYKLVFEAQIARRLVLKRP